MSDIYFVLILIKNSFFLKKEDKRIGDELKWEHPEVMYDIFKKQPSNSSSFYHFHTS